MCIWSTCPVHVLSTNRNYLHRLLFNIIIKVIIPVKVHAYVYMYIKCII